MADDRPCSHDGTFADNNPREDNRAGADPAATLEHNLPGRFMEDAHPRLIRTRPIVGHNYRAGGDGNFILYLDILWVRPVEVHEVSDVDSLPDLDPAMADQRGSGLVDGNQPRKDSQDPSEPVGHLGHDLLDESAR